MEMSRSTKKSFKNKNLSDQIIDIDDLENPKAQRNALIMDRVFAGDTYVQIGEMFGLTPAAISYIAKQNGYHKRPAS